MVNARLSILDLFFFSRNQVSFLSKYFIQTAIDPHVMVSFHAGENGARHHKFNPSSHERQQSQTCLRI